MADVETDLYLYENITQCLTMAGVAKKSGRNPKEEDLNILENASVVVNGATQKIAWIGPHKNLPEIYKNLVHRIPCHGSVWMPELVECHSHSVFAGNRSQEFGQRAMGKSYKEIAASGGGILSTLKATRDASTETLVESLIRDADTFQKFGVGALEVKSGYGLSLESELRLLKVIHQAGEKTPVRLVPTFLPAHAVPPEFRGRAEDYVNEICKNWIPEVARQKLAVFFDVFVEDGYFSVAQGRKLLMAAQDHGLRIKIHSEQFSRQGSVSLGVEFKATSLDHLEQIHSEDISTLAASETVAVLAPGACLFTGTPYAPARALIDAGAIVALTTDYNPGTSPTHNLPLMTTIACTQMRMTVPEVLAAVTFNAAKAIGLESEMGTIEVGKSFRVCQFTADHYTNFAYRFGELE